MIQLTFLKFRSNDLQTIKYLSNLSHLKILHFETNNYLAEDVDCFSNLKKLTMKLCYSEIDYKKSTNLYFDIILNNLTYLRIEDVYTYKMLTPNIHRLTNLKILKLNDVNILKYKNYFENASRLEKLKWSLGKYSPKIFKLELSHKYNIKLKYLELDNIGYVSLNKLTNLINYKLKYVNELKIDNYPILILR